MAGVNTASGSSGGGAGDGVAVAAEAAARAAADALLAPLASPSLTGTPDVPTAAPGTNTAQAASTAYTTAAVAVEAAARGSADTTLTAYVDAGIAALQAGKLDVTPAADINANSHKVINLATPSASTDATTKAYVDALAQGLSAKSSCVAASTANLTLSGAQTIDGVAVVAGNRVLVKNQSAPAQNGIYVAASGAWSRATDMDTWTETQGAYTLVTSGTANASTGWVSQTTAGGTLDSTAITFAQFNAASSISSVFTRTGAVVAQTGDYTVAQVTGAAPLASPAFTSTPTAPTAAALTNTTQLATTAFGTAAVAVETAARTAADVLLAPLASPALTGTPVAPTAAAATNTTQIATTAFATAAVAAEATSRSTADALLAPLASPALTGTPTAPTQTVGNSSTRVATTAFVAAAVGTTVTAAQVTASQAGAPATSLTASQAQIGTTVTITPRSTGSKILLVARLDLNKDATATLRICTARLWRGAVTSGVQVGTDALSGSSATSGKFQTVLYGIDSPGTTSAVSYRLSAAGDITTTLTAARYEVEAIELLWGGYDQTTPVDWTSGATGAVARSALAKAADIVSVKDFGAVADLVTTSATGSISAASATLTVSGASFVLADVGKLVVVPGAGVAGADLYTTIAGFTSATVVTLAATASTNVSTKAVTYGTNNSTAFANALAAAATVFVPAGSYATSSPVVVANNQRLLGSGVQTATITKIGTGTRTTTSTGGGAGTVVDAVVIVDDGNAASYFVEVSNLSLAFLVSKTTGDVLHVGNSARGNFHRLELISGANSVNSFGPWLSRFQSIRALAATTQAFNFGSALGKTTLRFSECYAESCTNGWLLNNCRTTIIETGSCDWCNAAGRSGNTYGAYARGNYQATAYLFQVYGCDLTLINVNTENSNAALIIADGAKISWIGGHIYNLQNNVASGSLGGSVYALFETFDTAYTLISLRQLRFDSVSNQVAANFLLQGFRTQDNAQSRIELDDDYAAALTGYGGNEIAGNVVRVDLRENYVDPEFAYLAAPCGFKLINKGAHNGDATLVLQSDTDGTSKLAFGTTNPSDVATTGITILNYWVVPVPARLYGQKLTASFSGAWNANGIGDPEVGVFSAPSVGGVMTTEVATPTAGSGTMTNAAVSLTLAAAGKIYYVGVHLPFSGVTVTLTRFNLSAPLAA